MKKELNIAAILKDKPKGTKFYSTPFGECTFDGVTNDDDICFLEQSNSPFCTDGYGKYSPNGECLVFPSKQMQDWSKFAWKKGDVLTDEKRYVIFNSFENDDYTEFFAPFEYNNTFRRDLGLITNEFRKANDDIAQEVIKRIEEHYGGKLNLETLDIEHPKQEFKDGDIVVVDKNKEMNLAKIIAIYNDGDILLGFNSYAYLNVSLEKLNFCSEVLVCGRIPRLASEEENQQLFDALAKEGKRWNPDTKLFEDLPKKCEFKPMDWCLMKDSTKYWELCQFAYTRKAHGTTIYGAVGGLIYYKCIPYNEETKHLLGTTDDWKGGEA